MRIRIASMLGVGLLVGASWWASAVGTEYELGPRDQISVVVYGEDDLTREVEVANDGTVKLPLIGRVKVSGLTEKQAEERITELYQKDYLVEPRVEVRIKDYRSQSVHLLGAVRRPGEYPLKGPVRVLDVLGKGGGVAEHASKFLLIIRDATSSANFADADLPGSHAAARTLRGSVTPIRVDIARLMGGDLGQNLPVHNGDLLFVPRAHEIYLLGEVSRPGSLPFSEGLTLLQAISKVGGFTKVAQEKKVQVIRIENGVETQRTFNLKRIATGKDKDFPLAPEDLIVVPESIL